MMIHGGGNTAQTEFRNSASRTRPETQNEYFQGRHLSQVVDHDPMNRTDKDNYQRLSSMTHSAGGPSAGPIVVNENDLSTIVQDLNDESLFMKLDAQFNQSNEPTI